MPRVIHYSNDIRNGFDPADIGTVVSSTMELTEEDAIKFAKIERIKAKIRDIDEWRDRGFKKMWGEMPLVPVPSRHRDTSDLSRIPVPGIGMEVMIPQEAVQLLRISRRTLLDLSQDKTIPSGCFGTKFRYSSFLLKGQEPPELGDDQLLSCMEASQLLRLHVGTVTHFAGFGKIKSEKRRCLFNGRPEYAISRNYLIRCIRGLEEAV